MIGNSSPVFSGEQVYNALRVAGYGRMIDDLNSGQGRTVAEMQRFILRVLTGPNAGAEALLGERTVVGSGESDDLTIGDGALAAGHFTIQVKGETLVLVVGDTPLTVKAEAKGKGAYQIAPFDLIKFGSTCCAIGPEGVPLAGLRSLATCCRQCKRRLHPLPCRMRLTVAPPPEQPADPRRS